MRGRGRILVGFESPDNLFSGRHLSQFNQTSKVVTRTRISRPDTNQNRK